MEAKAYSTQGMLNIKKCRYNPGKSAKVKGRKKSIRARNYGFVNLITFSWLNCFILLILSW